jgi:hypothetical protein
MADKEGAEEMQWMDGSTQNAAMPGSTDLGLREMDEMEQNRMMRSSSQKLVIWKQ